MVRQMNVSEIDELNDVTFKLVALDNVLAAAMPESSYQELHELLGPIAERLKASGEAEKLVGTARFELATP